MSKIFNLNKISRSQFLTVRCFRTRADLKNSKKVIVKLGSAVITREDECGIALGRLASIVEQISQLQNSGKQMLMVTSGAVAFGKQILRQETMMKRSVRDALTKIEKTKLTIDARACAASGQSGLMALYGAMFQQYGVSTAQVLVTKNDFENEYTRKNLKSTLNELLDLNIVPILNTNDAVAPPPQENLDIHGVISIKDNDSLAARLAGLIHSDLLILMSDVDGLYNSPPTNENSRLLHTFCPKTDGSQINFGEKSKVGTGGMQSKVQAATWALNNDCSVVICNGKKENAIIDIIEGKTIGTCFTNIESSSDSNSFANYISAQNLASKARCGSRILQNLPAIERSQIINKYAKSLVDRSSIIMEANKLDVEMAKSTNLNGPLLGRLLLSESKLKTLSVGLEQIAKNTNILGKVIKSTKLAENLILKQITVPIGVLLVIFESRPDSLPQISALSICSGNGLLLKGGHEALNTNKVLHELVQDALESYAPRDTISLLTSRDEINELLELDTEYIDLIIPRGSSQLVKYIQKNSKYIPVMGHSEGICHIFVDKECEIESALKIIKDSKCSYPTACNSVETLLIHTDLISTNEFTAIIDLLEKENVKIHSGPNLSKLIKFAPSIVDTFRKEYSDLEITIEAVDSVQAAVSHINSYGSHHTDSIITKNSLIAEYFLKNIDSACVFHNASTRFSDGYRFGLGAEVGISTGRLHARGPVGVEGLLTTKWILQSVHGDTADEFTNGTKTFTHETIDPLIFNKSIDEDYYSNEKFSRKL